MPIKYQNYFNVGQAGQIATLQDWNVKTRNAQQPIKFGRAVMVGIVPGVDVNNIYKSSANLVYSVDFVTGNSTIVTVNGVSTPPISFMGDHTLTLVALVAAVNALDGVSATGVGRTLSITTDGAVGNITASSITTGGAGQPTNTVSYSSVGVFEGIAALRHAAPITVGGDDQYQINDAVNVLTKGDIWVEVVSTVAYNDAVYVYNDKSNPANQGQFTKDASGNLLVAGAKFISAATGTTGTPALARVEINQPS